VSTATAKTEEQQPDIRSLLAQHGVKGLPWYAVIDAAQDSTTPQRAREANLRVQSLYEGKLGARLDDVAPHLTTFEPDGEFAGWLCDNWGGNHGIVFQSKATFEDLRKHFRRFLMVQDGTGKRFRFRFYDPRVLRAFLPVCTRGELAQFFGPVECFYTATRPGTGVLAFPKNA
jgi:hypothetical protein